MTIKHRVEYMLKDVDHIPVTMDYDTKDEARSEVIRLIQYPDIVMLRYVRIDTSASLKDGPLRRAIEAHAI